MTTKRIFKRLPLVVAGIAMGLGVFINVNTSKNAEPVQAAIDYSACETAHNANNKSNLKTALYNVVKNGSPGSYNDLWTSYLTVYKKSDGYLKDYYSNTSTFTSANQDNGSGGTTEGDKYNREHTIPKSWWGGSTSNQGADIFIVVPADKLVNNKRSDNCLGVVGSATFTSNNNYSKLGTSSSAWNFFGSPVFEPNDEVKGDLARIVFYSIIKYDVSSWTTGNGSYVFSGNTSASSNFGLTANAIKLFSYWNNLDKPDDWERTVNTRGNTVQGNPNPFIDHPEYANTLWGDVSGYTTYSTSSASLSVSPSSGSITVGNTLNLTATASGGSGNVTWSITSGSSYVSLDTTTGNSVTVTGVATGTANVTASYSGTTASCSITVTSSGSGEGQTTYTQLTSISNIDNSANYVLGLEGTGFHYAGTSSWGSIALPSSQTPLYYTLTKGSGNTSFTAKTTINSTIYYLTVPTTNTFTMSTSSTSITLGTSTTGLSGENSSYAVTNSSTTARHLRINGSSGLRSYAATTGTMAYFYKVNDSASAKTLSSISVSTAPTKTTYTAGQYFDPTGLVITRTYLDFSSDTYTYAGHTTEFTFLPTTSTALTTSNKSVTISYGGKSCSQAITVNQATVTSITASVSKTYYVGDTISASDITVKDNNDNIVNSFNFANDGYQFTYSDAASGGTLTNKTFTNAISGSNKTCSLTVQVQRKAHSTNLEEDFSVTYTDLPTTYQTSTTERTAASGVKFIAYNLANYSSKMQFKASGGYFQTTQAMTLKTLTINNRESNALTVYGSNSSSSFSTTITGTNDVYNLSGYTYFKIMKNGSGAAYCSDIVIKIEGAETPLNVANYIMYEDTNNQCVSKLNNAITYLGNLSSSNRSTFASSNDYVISTARERLNAWAANQGKTIDYTNATMSNRSGVSLLDNNGNNNAITLIIIISLVGTTSIGIFFHLRKKHEN